MKYNIHLNAGYPQTVHTPANKNTITAAVVCDHTKHHMTTGNNSSPKVLEVLPDNKLDPEHFLKRVHLFLDNHPVYLLYMKKQGFHNLIVQCLVIVEDDVFPEH
jgi:hypothetical protein